MGLIVFLPNPLIFLVVVAASAFGLVVHNLAQAYLADRFGDPTPRRQGFLTLDPSVHFDPLGLLLLLLLGFGWPRFVPYDLRWKKAALVALMGPVGFMLAALAYMLLARLLPADMGLFPISRGLDFAAVFMVRHAAVYLFPVPPLDGARIAHALGGPEVRRFLNQIRSWGPVGFLLIFLVLDYTGVISRVELGIYGFLDALLASLGL